jgi:3',5'-cyclic AMP phosphodiesterase CpdA
MSTLAHLSDLHFGTEDPAVVRGLLLDLARVRPLAVVVSGDLTQRARTREFLACRRFLDRLPAPALVVPGNHDVVPLHRPFERLLTPFAGYREHIALDLEPALDLGRVALQGICTPRALAVTSGRVSREQLGRLRARLAPLPRTTFKVLVAHHPFLMPTWGRHHSLIGGIEDALTALDHSGVDLLLAGHLHVPFVGGSNAHPALRGHTLVVQAGTAVSRRTRGEANSYNVIEVHGDEVRVEVRLWSGDRFTDGGRDLYRRHDGRWRREGGVSPTYVRTGG